MLVNLLTNAVKFTGDDGVITVTAARTAGEAIDRGAPTPASASRRTTSRGSSNASTAPMTTQDPKTAGTGLGLAIVQAITTQYGGTLTVDSELGKGSTFTLTLPLADLDA